VMQLHIKVNEQGVIEDAKFKCFGCGSAIASSSDGSVSSGACARLPRSAMRCVPRGLRLWGGGACCSVRRLRTR
jgi:hypothetical protein